MGNLQYRSDTDRLIVNSGGNLLAECCCDTCDDAGGCWQFIACCDSVTEYAQLLDYPHWIIISDTKYQALGSPDCVVYSDCCYCTPTSSTKGVTVNESLVTASSYSSCGDCIDYDGDDCLICNGCNDCNPPLLANYNISFSGIVSPASYWLSQSQTLADAAEEEINGLVLEASYDTGCYWQYRLPYGYTIEYFGKYGGVGFGYPVVSLDWYLGAWRLTVYQRDSYSSFTFPGHYNAHFENTSSSACDPTGVYTLVSGTDLFSAGTATVS